jgi:hypothetical protein
LIGDAGGCVVLAYLFLWLTGLTDDVSLEPVPDEAVSGPQPSYDAVEGLEELCVLASSSLDFGAGVDPVISLKCWIEKGPDFRGSIAFLAHLN